MRIVSIGAAACFALASAPALAWDSFGHMEVAAVAWQKLTPTARARVADLLKVNPMYSALIKGASPSERDQIAFVRAATWPDQIKSTPGYIPDGTQGGDRPPPDKKKAAQNIGYSDKNMHKYWHFIDEPFSTDGTPLEEPSTPNAETQIALFRATLSSNASPDIKSYDLVWLEHLVGDVHQPLHSTSRFTHDRPHGDAGGNAVAIQCGSGCSAPKLHPFWDDVLGTSNDPHAAINAASQLPEAAPEPASIADEKVWIRESFEAAKQYAYAQPIGVGDPPYTLTDAYKSDALKVAKERVALAGARLANLLNQALK